MRISELLAAISAGSVLVLTSAILIGAGIALGINQAAPTVPLWSVMLLVGIVLGVVGILTVSIGSQKTSEKVEETLTLQNQISQHPFIAAAVAVGLGLVLYRLVRGGGTEVRVAAAPRGENGHARRRPTPGVKDFLSEKLWSLGKQAGTAAVMVGLNSLGVSSLEKLLDEVISGKPKRGRHEGAKPRQEGREPARPSPRFNN